MATDIGVMVGGDVHKYTHTLVAVDRTGQERGCWSVGNEPAALAGLVRALQQLGAQAPGRLQVVLEDAHGNGARLADALLTAGLATATLAPGLIAQRRRRTTLHASKSDVEDARLIAKVAWIEPQHVRPVQRPAPQQAALAHWHRWRTVLVRERRSICNLLHLHLYQTYPTYRDLLADPCSQAARRFWARFPTADQLAGVRRATVERVLAGPRGTRGLPAATRARVWEKVHALPASPSSEATLALAAVIQALLRRLTALDADLAAATAALTAALPPAARLLLTIPGIQAPTAATIALALGDVARFSHGDAVARFAGVAPRMWSSAQRGGLHTSNRGHRALHSALYLLALRRIAQPSLERTYFERKVDAGKPKRQALTCLMRQLCRVIYAILRDHRPYVLPSSPALGGPA